MPAVATVCLSGYLAKSENPMYLCFKNNPSSHNLFSFRPVCAAERSGSEPRRLRGVGILQERVYKHHRITDVEELRQRVEEEWDRLNPDQEVIDNAISEWRKRLTACVAAGGGRFCSRLMCMKLTL